MRRIELTQIQKSYRHYRSPWSKLGEILLGKRQHQEIMVLEPMSLAVENGEVVGLIGVNGAGKSTLLKIIAETILPTSGTVKVEGRVCALLELGAGFHPEMTGRENVYLTAAIQGRTQDEIDQVFDEILDFSGLRDVIDRPVKTYSSGMLIRLAFSVATSVDPDILILDEALSVGDGAFARKSFEKIMAFRDLGKTIFFCSHSMYQIEAICSRALWIHQGRIRQDGAPAEVVVAYNSFLDGLNTEGEHGVEVGSREASVTSESPGTFRFEAIRSLQPETSGRRLVLQHLESDLLFEISFRASLEKNPPTVALTVVGARGRPIASVSSLNEGILLKRNEGGLGSIRICFPRIPLLKGRYWVNFFLLCDQGLHVYDQAEQVFELEVHQKSAEIGFVTLPHRWAFTADDEALAKQKESAGFHLGGQSL